MGIPNRNCRLHHAILALLFWATSTGCFQIEECLDADGCQLEPAPAHHGSPNYRKESANIHLGNGSLLRCRGRIDIEYSTAITSLHVCNYHNHTLHLKSIVRNFPNVHRIEVLHSNISHLIGPTKFNNITFLRIFNSTLQRVSDNFPVNMRHLHVLDLRNNMLETLPVRSSHNQRLKHIYLSNNRWNCSEEHLKWAWNYNISNVQDHESVTCFDELFADKPLFRIAKYQKDLFAECPTICECHLVNVVRELDDFNVLTPKISVSCINKGLSQLPERLPNLTKILHLENNSISDLSPIVTNRAYKHLLELYLDNNEVKSIAILEGGQWLEEFSVLSLRANKLVQLPTYALDHALERNRNMPNAVLFYLAGNPWRCDCAYTPHFQDMLVKYELQIADLEDVRCRSVPGDENSRLPILSLTRSSICRQPSEYYIKPLDLVNIILASLIVLVLGKFAYDYYFFKKTGRLPWIVSKMP